MEHLKDRGINENWIPEILLRALTHVVFTRAFDDLDRRKLADYVGVDLKEWKVNEAWLQKKTKAEIIDFLKSGEFMKDQAFLKWMRDKHDAGNLDFLAGLKKSEIVDMIMKSGCNLNRVPAEILNLSKKESWIETRIMRDREKQDNQSAGEEEPECYRELGEETGEWACMNDVTGCMYNDGQNGCTHEGDRCTPLEDEEV